MIDRERERERVSQSYLVISILDSEERYFYKEEKHIKTHHET